MGCGASKSQTEVVAERAAAEKAAAEKFAAQTSPKKPPKAVKVVDEVDDESPQKNSSGTPRKLQDHDKPGTLSTSEESSKEVLREIQSEAKGATRISELDELDEKWDEDLKPSKPAANRAANGHRAPTKALSPVKNTVVNGRDPLASMSSKIQEKDKSNESGWTARIAPSGERPSMADSVSIFDRHDSPGRDAEPMQEEVSAFHSTPTPPQPTGSSLPPIAAIKPSAASASAKKPGPGRRNYDDFDDEEDEDDDLLNEAEKLLNEGSKDNGDSSHEGQHRLSLISMAGKPNGIKPLKPGATAGNSSLKGKPPPPPKMEPPPPPPPTLSAEDALWKSIQDSYHRQDDESPRDRRNTSVASKGKERKGPARKVEKFRAGRGDEDDGEDASIEEVYQPTRSQGTVRMHEFYSHGSTAVPGSDMELAISPAASKRAGNGGKAGEQESGGKGPKGAKPPPVQHDGSGNEMSDEESSRGGVPKFHMVRPNLANDPGLFLGADDDELDDGDVINLQGDSKLNGGPPHPKKAASGWGVDKLDSLPRMDVDGGFEDEDEGAADHDDDDDDSDGGQPWKAKGVPAFR